MSKLSKKIEFLEYSAEKDIERINKLECEIKKRTIVEYGEEHISIFGTTRLDAPVVDVVNSILKHLQLEISYKDFPVTTITEAGVIFKSTKKKVIKKKIKAN